MYSSDFSILIGRLERQADERPQLYTAKVAVVAALGYLIPALAAIGVLAALILIVQSVIAIGRPAGWMVLGGAACAVLLVATLRSLWVSVEEPEELQISRDAAPDLFALIDNVTSRIDGATIMSVSVHGDFCAGIRQIPRWGVFGGYRNHLHLGVPLLIALDVEEFTAILAHEMSHLRGQQEQFSAWIYRQRNTWNLLRQKFADPASAFDRVLAVFYGWYAPWFYAFSFVLARNHEYECDHVAAAITNPASLGRALIKQELVGRFLSQVFWERLFAQVEKSPEPPWRPYSIMARGFKVAEKEWARPQWLTEALSSYAAEDDTHPSLAERLTALELEPMLPAFEIEASALHLLGPLAPELINHCDESWSAENAADWRQRHDEIREARWKIAEYEQYELGALGAEDLWAKADLLLTVNREDEGIETLQQLVAREGAFPKAHLLLAQLLLAHNDERGLPHLVSAAEQDVELASTAGSIGYTYLVNRGRKGEAMRFWRRISPYIGG